MTFNEVAYMILETIRENHIVDDERLDIRLIKDWVNMKRAQFIKNSRTNNPNGRTNLNLYQLIDVTVEVSNSTDAGNYPYANATTQLYKIVNSTVEIPTIIEDRSGPMILSLESEDNMKLPFSVVDYDHLRFAGNGRFNTSIIYGAIRDNLVYFKYNTFFDTYTDVKLRAIVEDPRLVGTFDDDVDRYPADLGLIEYIKNAVFDKDVRMLFTAKTDEVNDSDGKVE